MSTDRQKLESLRVSVGRIAQALGITGTEINVVGHGGNDLIVQAQCEERGWNDLAAKCIDAINARDQKQAIAAWDEQLGQSLVNTLNRNVTNDRRFMCQNTIVDGSAKE